MPTGRAGAVFLMALAIGLVLLLEWCGDKPPTQGIDLSFPANMSTAAHVRRNITDHDIPPPMPCHKSPWPMLRTRMNISQLTECPTTDEYLSAHGRAVYGLSAPGGSGVAPAPRGVILIPRQEGAGGSRARGPASNTHLPQDFAKISHLLPVV